MSMFEVKYDTLTEVGRTIARTKTLDQARIIASEAEHVGFWNVRVEEVPNEF